MAFILVMLGMHAMAQEIQISGEYPRTNAAQILKTWTRDYVIRFAYDSYELSRCTGNWTFQQLSPEEALHTLLAPCDCEFQLADGQYLIYPTKHVEAQEITDLIPKEDQSCFFQMRVIDAVSKEPVPFVAAQWEKNRRGASANDLGVVKLPCVNELADTLRIMAVGYHHARMAASVFSTTASSTFLVEMIPESNLLPPIVIDEGNEPNFRTHGFPRQFIMKPYRTAMRYGTGEQDVFRAIQTIPGVGATMELSQGIFLRGSPLDQTLVVLDDFTIYHTDHLFGTFAAINANAVQSAKLYRDMSDARWGGRAAGVLELVAREGNKKDTHVRLDMGALSGGITWEGPLDSKKKSVLMVTARRSFTDVFYSGTYKKLFNTLYSSSTSGDRVDGFKGAVPPDFVFQDINAKLTVRPSKRDAIYTSYYASSDRLFVQYADTGNVAAGDFLDARYTDEGIKRNQGLSMRWNRQLSSMWSSRISSGFSRFQGSYFSSDTLTNNLLMTDSAQFNSTSFQLNDWTSRAEWIRGNGQLSDCFGIQYTFLSTLEKSNERGVFFDTTDVQSSAIAGYWSRVWNLRHWNIQSGARFTYYTPFAKFYPEPRFHLTYHGLDEKLEGRFGFSRSHQFIQLTTTQSLYGNVPDIWNIATRSGSPILVMDDLHMGATYQWKDLTMDVDVFSKRFRGMSSTLLLSFPENLSSVNTNSSDGSIRGMDGVLQYVHNHHEASVSFMWMKTSAADRDDDITIHPFVFNHAFESKFQYEWKWRMLRMSALYVYGSGRPYTAYLGTYSLQMPDNSNQLLPVYGSPNGAILPAYQRLDFVVTYQWSWNGMRGTLCGSVFNLLNHRNVRSRQYVASPSTNQALSANMRDAMMLPRLPTINLTIEL